MRENEVLSNKNAGRPCRACYLGIHFRCNATKEEIHELLDEWIDKWISDRKCEKTRFILKDQNAD